MNAIRKGKIVKKISWTETIKGLEVGEYVIGDLADRINIVRHISRISKEENKTFRTKKLDSSKVEVRREA